ncbi:MAG: hypothetical protein MJZ98_00220 [Paludibacteraceae bacterium]|nr:hypothetical protein [Paludibacteraceae bacterium]
MNKTNSILLVVAAAAVVVMGILLYNSKKKQKEAEENIAAMEEVMNYEKEKLADEYTNVADELKDFHLQTNNDSILRLLDKEQKRVQLLMDELKNTKATNAKRIAELRKELSSVRSALSYYVAQVDSLNRVNGKLLAENKEVRELYESASATVQTLSEEKDQLTEKVNIASQLKARNISVTTLNESGKAINRLRKIAIIKVTYDVVENITAKSGEKTTYMRITAPDHTVCGNNNNTFMFEGREIPYTSKKNFEFSGQETSQSIVWNVSQSLTEGTYRVELFIDGHLVGGKSFELK